MCTCFRLSIWSLIYLFGLSVFEPDRCSTDMVQAQLHGAQCPSFFVCISVFMHACACTHMLRQCTSHRSLGPLPASSKCLVLNSDAVPGKMSVSIGRG